MFFNPFENVSSQIGYCGIWCGSCVVGNGTLSELTRRYNELISDYDLESWAPKDFDFKELLKGLSSIQSMPQCDGCLKGDGNPDCVMRLCAKQKGRLECIECSQHDSCENSEKLVAMRTGAKKAGLIVKMNKVTRQEFIDSKTLDLMKKWPSYILFEGR